MTACIRITSRANAFIKFLHSLHDRKARDEHGKFLAEGIRTCSALLDSPIVYERLIVTDEWFTQAQEMVPLESIVLVNNEAMSKVSPAATPSGMVGLFNIPPQPPLEQLSSGLVLAGIADPGNMGTLIRSAVVFGSPLIVLVGGVDPWNFKAVQASAGTIGHSRLFRLSWEDVVKHVRAHNAKLLALVVTGGEDPRRIAYRDNYFFVVGGEAHGIPLEWVLQCDQKITLPMSGAAESLNAAIAGSLALALVYWEQHPVV